MINFKKKPNQIIKDLRLDHWLAKAQELGRDQFLYQTLPRLMMELLRQYFRLEVVGLENVPRRGRAIVAPNHSGYSGFDALLLTHILNKDLNRIPRVLTHQFWFLSKATARPAQKMGFTEATYENGVNQLKKNNLIVLFPEGEIGNFKPTSQAYQLQEFKRGFVRMAVETQAPIIPTLIIGAEETHINLKQLKLPKALQNLIVPLPLNIIPLPVRWKIIFLPPLILPYQEDSRHNRDLMREVADDIQEQMQEALSAALVKRGKKIF